jgi:hypothetical protein
VAVELWRQLLAAGGRAAPVAAGDVHSTTAAAGPRTATFVYARARGAAQVMVALRERRVFASSGPRLDFWLQDQSGNIALVGSRVGPGEWTAHTSPPAQVREVALDDGGHCLIAERRDADQRLEAISAPIWIASAH